MYVTSNTQHSTGITDNIQVQVTGTYVRGQVDVCNQRSKDSRVL